MLSRDEEHIYWIDDKRIVPSVTQVLKEEGFYDFRGVPESVLEYAGDKGTAVHKACELHDLGTLDYETLDLQLVPFLEGWAKFKKQYQIESKYIIWIEKMFYSKKWGFAGTVDRIINIKGKNILVDIKTGVYSPATGIQLAGYQILAEEGGIRVNSRWAVYLTGTGKFSVATFTEKNDKNIFLGALNSYKWKKEKNKKGGKDE